MKNQPTSWNEQLAPAPARAKGWDQMLSLSTTSLLNKHLYF